MNERRQIVIPTGGDPDTPLPTPHFDTEATLTARPVVPLSEQENLQMQYGGYASRAGKPLWKRPALLALIVLAAIGVGVAAGLSIGIYKNRNNAEPSVTSAPSSSTPSSSAPSPTTRSADVSQVVERPAPTPVPQVHASMPEKPVETPAEPKAEERERTVRSERKADDDEKPPVVRDRKREKNVDDNDDQELDDRHAERDRRREEKRDNRRRQRERETVDIPRQVERVVPEANRIREIFEGKQP